MLQVRIFFGLSLDYPHWLFSRGFLGDNSDGLASISDMIPVFSCFLSSWRIYCCPCSIYFTSSEKRSFCVYVC